MSNESESDRTSKIEREKVDQILKKIGAPPLSKGFLPRKCKVGSKKEKQVHYLTAGALNERVISSLEAEYKGAYKLPLILARSKTPTTRRSRGAFRSLHTYRSRLEAFKPERLFVPQDFSLPGKSITEDIDPEFYSIITGSAVKVRGNLRQYSLAVRECFRTQLQSCRLHEEVSKLKQSRKEEEDVLKKAEQALQEQIDGFDKFLQDDHAASAKLLTEAEAAINQGLEREERLRALEKELEATQTRVMILEERFQYSKMLQKFLFSIAPLPWRRLQEKAEVEEGDPCQRFVGLPAEASDTERTNEKTEVDGSLSIYFEDPQQLQKMFRDLEEKNIGALLQRDKMKPAVRTMNKALLTSLEEFRRERLNLEEDVTDLRTLVMREEARAKQLEEKAKFVSEGHLRVLLKNKLAISISACVLDAFEHVIGPSDQDLDTLTMLQAVENSFQTLQLELDVMPKDVVKQVVASQKKEEKLIMREAQVAAKKVHQMNRIVQKFTIALKPWTAHYAVKRKLMRRSSPAREIIIKEPPPLPLTTSQIEQRRFFELAEENDMYRPMA